MTVELFRVGGSVRDDALARLNGQVFDPHDEDFTVVDPDGFDHLVSFLESERFKIFVTTPEFLTVRAKVPEQWRDRICTSVADFVLARADSPTSDGRRPDFVTPGTLLEDLARRDFTVNAMARDMQGNLVDPHNGMEDLQQGVLRFVGEPLERVQEDGLRVLRGLRFMVTKNLVPEAATRRALVSPTAVERLAGTSIERVREELHKMFAHDTLTSMHLLCSFFNDNFHLEDAIFRDGLHLEPSLKKIK